LNWDTGTKKSSPGAFLADLQVVMDDLRMEDGRLVYRWSLSGTNDGPGGTGRRVHISRFEMWTLGQDGLIAESTGQFDEAGYKRQLEARTGSAGPPV
jgi:hypothetical protein